MICPVCQSLIAPKKAGDIFSLKTLVCQQKDHIIYFLSPKNWFICLNINNKLIAINCFMTTTSIVFKGIRNDSSYFTDKTICNIDFVPFNQAYPILQKYVKLLTFL
jgi:hypothetical protein